MAIIDKKEVWKPFMYKAAGYVKALISSEHVEMDNGCTLQETVDNINSSLLNKVYPVGSIYISINTANPEELLGGKWSPWGAGRVPVGVDTSQAEFNAVQKTGGEKSHWLTEGEMPSHYGHVPADGEQWGIGNTARYMDSSKLTAYGSGGRGWSVYSSNEAVPGGKYRGGNTAHNNLQPYITCCMWVRTL